MIYVIVQHEIVTSFHKDHPKAVKWVGAAMDNPNCIVILIPSLGGIGIASLVFQSKTSEEYYGRHAKRRF